MSNFNFETLEDVKKRYVQVALLPLTLNTIFQFQGSTVSMPSQNALLAGLGYKFSALLFSTKAHR